MQFQFKAKWKAALYAATTLFLTYTVIFGFRKSFTVCTFDGLMIGSIPFKTLLVISQVLGYMLAKFYGVKFISELKPAQRFKIIISFTLFAWLCWLGFALVPMPFNIVFLFLNGFPLGLLWGVIFSYVEGRTTTDFIGAALAVSFIFSSGFIKSVGGWLQLNFNLTDFWIPFYTGLTFILPFLFFVWLIEKIPAADAADYALRVQRLPIDANQRKKIIRQFLPGLIACIVIYVLATIFRDIRDNFSADMWKEMGYTNIPSIFTQTETPISILMLMLIGLMVFVKKSFKAFMIAHLFIALGFVIAGVGSYLFIHQYINTFYWMLATGMGLYAVYIPFNSIFFDRMIAAFKITGNVGFLIYLADSFGYLGSIGVLLFKTFAQVKLSWTLFFSSSVLYLSIVGLGLSCFSATYFYKKIRKQIACG